MVLHTITVEPVELTQHFPFWLLGEECLYPSNRTAAASLGQYGLFLCPNCKHEMVVMPHRIELTTRRVSEHWRPDKLQWEINGWRVASHVISGKE